MNHKSTITLLILAVLLSILALFSDKVAPVTSDISAQNTIFPSLSLTNLQELSINSGPFQTLLRKSVWGWHLVYMKRGQKIIEDFADRKMLERLIDELISLQTVAPAKQIHQQDLWNNYGLGILAQAQGNSIRLHYGSLVRTLHIGIDALQKNGLAITHARKDNANSLLRINSQIRRWLRNSKNNPDFLRSKTPFHLSANQIPAQIFYHDASKIVLEKKQQWYWHYQHQNHRERADNAQCARLLRVMRNMHIYKFLHGGDSHKHFAANSKLLGYKDIANEEYMVIGSRVTRDDVDCYYAARVFFEDQQQKIAYSYLLTASRVEQLFVGIDNFRSSRVLPATVNAITKIISHGTEHWQLELKDNHWFVSSPRQRQLDSREVKRFIRKLQGLASKDFTPSAEKLLNRLSLYAANETIQLAWGKLRDRMAIHVQGEREARLFPMEATLWLHKTYLDFYNKRVDAFVFANVVKLIIVQFDRIYEVQKHPDHNSWHLKQTSTTVARGHIEEILRNCAWIMAAGVLGEGESARKRYGCLQSSLRLTVHSQNGKPKIRIIEIGVDIEKDYCAIWVSGFPFVYKVRRKIKQLLLKKL